LDFVWRGRVGRKVDFQPVLRRAAGADALPGPVAAVSAAGSGAIEAFCARLRRRLLVFGVMDRENEKPRVITTFLERRPLPA
jgi:hypothetical protein